MCSWWLESEETAQLFNTMDKHTLMSLEVTGSPTLLGGEPPSSVMSRYPPTLSPAASTPDADASLEHAILTALEGGAKSLVVVGEEGSGKTTALERLAAGWARGDHLHNFSHVLPLRLRALDVGPAAPAESLEALMRRCGVPAPSVAAVLQKPEELLLLVDDLERCSWSPEPPARSLCSDPRRPAPPALLVLSLLRGSLLGGAARVAASRPSAAASSVSGRRLEVLGFLRPHREAFCHAFFREPPLAARALAQLERTLGFYQLCAAPRFCWSVCCTYERLMATGAELPETLSQLCVQLLLQLLHPLQLQQPDARKLLQLLGGLASRCALHPQTAAPPEEVGLPLLSHAALDQFLRRDGDPSSDSRSFSFRSALMQEFLLAASFLLPAAPAEGAESLLEKHRGHAHFLDAFLCALCEASQRRPLQALLGDFDQDRVEDFSEWLRVRSAAALSHFNKEEHHRCFQRLLQAQSRALVSRIITADARIGISYGGLSLQDAAALSYVLSCLDGVEVLNLYRSSDLTEEKVELLAPALSAARKIILSDSSLPPAAARLLASALSGGLAAQLELSNSRLEDHTFKLLCAGLRDCKLQTLRLRRCGLTEASCDDAASVLSSPASQLRVMEMSANQIADAGLVRMCRALQGPHCSLQELLLQSCGLTAASMEALAAALCSGQSQLRKVDLTQNQIGDRGAELLCQSLQNPLCPLRSLRLMDSELTGECCGALAEALMSPHCSVAELDLSVNELGQEGALLLCRGLGRPGCPVTQLGLQRCGLTRPVFEELSSLLMGGASKLASLSVGLSEVGDQGVRPLWDAVAHPSCRLEELDLEMCGLTDACVEGLCGALGSGRTLRRLQLSNNLLSDASVPALVRAVGGAGGLQELTLKYNDFSEEVFDALDECGKIKY